MILFLKVLMLFSLQSLLFALLLLKLLGYSQCFSAKKALWKLKRLYRANRSTAPLKNWQKNLSSHRSLLYSKHSSFLIDSIKCVSFSKSKWDSLSRLLYKNSPSLHFSLQLSQDTMSNKVLSSKKDNSFSLSCD